MVEEKRTAKRETPRQIAIFGIACFVLSVILANVNKNGDFILASIVTISTIGWILAIPFYFVAKLGKNKTK